LNIFFIADLLFHSLGNGEYHSTSIRTVVNHVVIFLNKMLLTICIGNYVFIQIQNYAIISIRSNSRRALDCSVQSILETRQVDHVQAGCSERKMRREAAQFSIDHDKEVQKTNVVNYR